MGPVAWRGLTSGEVWLPLVASSGLLASSWPHRGPSLPCVAAERPGVAGGWGAVSKGRVGSGAGQFPVWPQDL